MSEVGPKLEGLIKLSGTIRNYKVTRANANFVFTSSDKTRLGIVAIASSLAGLSGQAIFTASNASAEEEADYVQFDLDNKPVRGWLWRSPFAEGDVVEVAAEWQVDHYEAGGISRPRDHAIALYPHCSRGRLTHVMNAAKWWFLVTFGFVAVYISGMWAMGDSILEAVPSHDNGLAYIYPAICAFFVIATISITRKWMVFVHLAEKVFRTLDLPNPSNIDLVKSSKAQRKPDDPGEYGTFYFRY